MKILEKILIALFILTILLKAFNVNYSDIFFFVSLAILCFHYFPFGFKTLINLKKQPHLFKEAMLFGFTFGYGLASLLINIIFSGSDKIPYINKIIFMLAILFLILSLITSFFLYKKKNEKKLEDAKFYYFIIYRALVLIILLFLSYLPSL